MIPSDYNGLTPPPKGAPNVFSVYLDDAFDAVDALRLFDFHADFAVPANSTFTERPESPVAVAPFDSRSPGTFSGARNEIEEPPPAVTADYLNAIGDRLMLRLQYFNRGGTETLTTVQTVNGGIIRHQAWPPQSRNIARRRVGMCCKRPARPDLGRSRTRERIRPIRQNAGWAAQWSITPGIWPSAIQPPALVSSLPLPMREGCWVILPGCCRKVRRPCSPALVCNN